MILVMLNQQWMLRSEKYKNLGKIRITKKVVRLIRRPTFSNIIPHSPDDGSLEPKCYSVFLYIVSDYTPLFIFIYIYI